VSVFRASLGWRRSVKVPRLQWHRSVARAVISPGRYAVRRGVGAVSGVMEKILSAIEGLLQGTGTAGEKGMGNTRAVNII